MPDAHPEDFYMKDEIERIIDYSVYDQVFEYCIIQRSHGRESMLIIIYLGGSSIF
jgi:hypothetical protein